MCGYRSAFGAADVRAQGLKFFARCAFGRALDLAIFLAGAVLAAAGTTLMPIGSLCDVLDWDLERLHAAEAVLAAGLAAWGAAAHSADRAQRAADASGGS